MLFFKLQTPHFSMVEYIKSTYSNWLILMSLVHFISPATSNPFTQKPSLFSTLLYSIVPIMGIAAIVLLSFWMYRHHKLAYPPVLVPTQVTWYFSYIMHVFWFTFSKMRIKVLFQCVWERVSVYQEIFMFISLEIVLWGAVISPGQNLLLTWMTVNSGI